MDPDPASYISFILLQVQNPFTAETLALLGSIVLLLLLLVVSFLVSGAEVAFFSLRRVHLEQLKHDKARYAEHARELIAFPRKLLATILITNNIANVAAILVAGSIVEFFAEANSWEDELLKVLEIGVITSILLFVGEIVPKVYARRNRLWLIRIIASPLHVLMRLFSPFANLLINTSSFIERRVRLKEDSASLEDLKHAIDITSVEPTTQDTHDEKALLKGVVNFGNIAVKSVMRARVDVKAVDIETSFEDLLVFINEHSYSRLPVYNGDLDHIEGILHIKDLLSFLKDASPDTNWQDEIRNGHFVPESKKIDDMLEEFKKTRMHMAIVVDEFGGTAGIVTLEDVIEEIFGEISDEFDSDDYFYRKISDTEYLFEGRMPLNDIRKILDLSDDEFENVRGDNDSLGGLILELHGKIPHKDERIHHKHFSFLIESATERRIKWVKFSIRPAQDEHIPEAT